MNRQKQTLPHGYGGETLWLNNSIVLIALAAAVVLVSAVLIAFAICIYTIMDNLRRNKASGK